MSEYFEQTLCNTVKADESFASLCRLVFANAEGRKLLALLMKARHPMSPRFNLDNPDPIAAAFRDGQADVVALLWRKGSDLKSIPEPPKPKNDVKD